MYNVRLFHSFNLPPNSTSNDREFLDELIRIRDESEASYINFSAYRTSNRETEAIHFVTYPLDWVTHYIQSNYIAIDPLMHHDFRNISFVDWQEIRRTTQTEKFFDDFHQRGLGDHGIVLTGMVGTDTYGVSNFCFHKSDNDWETFRRSRMELFRFLCQSLCESYDRIYSLKPNIDYKITKREKECLYWVALGKTDEEIGKLLDIGKWTVVSHLKSAKSKLDCSNRSSAVARAIASGIIKIRP